MNDYVVTRTTCRCCGSADIVKSINLQPVPIVSPNVKVAQKNGEEKLEHILAPLDNYLCRDCGLNQLIHVVDPALIYKNYLYETNISLGLSQHFKSLQEDICRRLSLGPGARIIEFGSNDGTMLSHFKAEGMLVHGVDPADKASEHARKSGIPTITDFFSARLAQELKQNFGQAHAIISNNTMANIDNLADIFTGVETLLTDDGAFIFETQYALDVLEKTLLDVIYHEHVSYFSVKPLALALGRYGLELFHAERIAPKGGSIRFWIQKKGGPRSIEPSVQTLLSLEQNRGLYDLSKHKAFENKVNAINAQIRNMIASIEKTGGKVAAYGTSVGSAALIHQFELQNRLHCLFDDKPTKSVIEGPGYALPVHGPADVSRIRPDLIIVLAWRYADVIAGKHAAYFDAGGRFFVPLPDGRFIEQIEEAA